MPGFDSLSSSLLPSTNLQGGTEISVLEGSRAGQRGNADGERGIYAYGALAQRNLT